MEDRRDEQQPGLPCRTAQGFLAPLVFACLSLHTVAAIAAGPHRHFDLEAGDASIMLNEFSRQSDLQVLFDFNTLRGMKTRAVAGDLDASAALKAMLKGTNLTFDFVNDRTLAVTPAKPSLLARVWTRLNTHAERTESAKEVDIEQVLISGAGDGGTQPMLGAPLLQFNRQDIERSGFATTQDFLRTLPQIFGGGPNLSTVLGREAATNSNDGAGINIRGLDAGATLVLIDGHRLAPSGTAGAFDDISNIPLSIVERIDILPDATGARYGADAVGGAVNFVTRRNFSGVYTQARDGGVTDGHMGERQLSQLIGRTRDSGSDLLSFEYYQRDALEASARWQETSDLTPWGGSNFNLPYGSPGTITDASGHYWPIPKVQNGASLSAASLSQGAPNLYDQDVGKDITPREMRWSLFGKSNLRLTDSFDLSAEGLFARRKVRDITGSSDPLVLTVPQSNPFYVNPTGVAGPVSVVTGTGPFFGAPATDNQIDTGNFSLGASARLSGAWTATATVAYAFERQRALVYGYYDPTALNAALADSSPATAFNPFGNSSNINPATLAAVSATLPYNSMSTLKTLGITARGAMLALPGGDVETTLGTEYRIQSLQTSQIGLGGVLDSTGRLARNVTTAFGEFRIPIIGDMNALSYLDRLAFSAGARIEKYSDLDSATVPKFGALWGLSKDLTLHTTWSRAFRPPNLPDVQANRQLNAVDSLVDPLSPTGVTNVLVRSGTNPGLQPEKARTWTVGGDFISSALPGASMSLTYFNVAYSGRIDAQTISRDVLSQPNFSWLVNRNFTPAQLNNACRNGTFITANTCADTAIGAILDNRLQNIALLKTSGLDLIAKYSFGQRFGRFEVGLNSTYLFNYSQANTPGSPLVDIVSTQNNPIDFRARASAAWTHRGFGVATFVNFADSYRDTLSVPNRGISPWTTVDLQLSYETPANPLSWLANTQLVLNAQNLFNVYPPFLNNPVGEGYDPENAYLYGRLVSVEVRKRF